MSSTNKTTNLELSQFIGSDSPKWLTDYNADMEKIDAGYQTVKAQADATDLIVGGHSTSIGSLQTTVTEQGTAISGLRTSVNGNTGSINTINELLGNGQPTTTDKTIIGAINEIQAEVEAITPGGSVAASAVSYDNTTSGLSATDVQSAIDEVDAKVDAIVVPTIAVEKKTGTLAAGSTSITLALTSQTISATTFVDWFVSDPEVVPTAISTTSNSVIMTFEAQSAALTVGVRVEN